MHAVRYGSDSELVEALLQASTPEERNEYFDLLSELSGKEKEADPVLDLARSPSDDDK
jgi:hypothetical protein